MNFFINGAMGIGNSGVEHAQFYRAKRFDQVELPYRFVFVEIVKNIHEAMDQWNLRDDQVINMWEYFVLGQDYAKKGLEKRVEPSEDLVVDKTDTHRKRESVTSSGLRIVEHYVKYPDKHKPDSKMLMVSNGRTEMYDDATGEKRVMYENIDDQNRKNLITNIHLFNENGQHLFFRNELQLHRYFFEQLDKLYGGKSTFIVDRGEDNEVALMLNRIAGSKVVDVIHADHLSDRDDPKNPLWNNYNEYLLTHNQLVDRIVTATELQREDLLVDYPNKTRKFVTIPVGGVRDGIKKITRKLDKGPFKLITASRLASEKHVDYIVRAVAALKDEGFDLTFDIYGQGGESKKIKDTIEEVKAEDYVTLKGLSHDLEHVYPKYDAFISASLSEGFGLTYIEALNAALPVVTFDARFGASELIQDGYNGFSSDFKPNDDDYNVKQLTESLRRLLKSDYPNIVNNTQKSIEKFQDKVIAKKWEAMINEL